MVLKKSFTAAGLTFSSRWFHNATSVAVEVKVYALFTVHVREVAATTPKWPDGACHDRAGPIKPLSMQLTTNIRNPTTII